MNMTEEKFEPAKILSRPEKKPEEKASTPETSKAPEPGAVSVAGSPSPPGSNAGLEGREESWEGIIERFAGKDKATVVWAVPHDMYKNGVFQGLHQSTVDRVAQDIKGIVITTIFHAYLLIGYYLLAVYFDCDESQVFSKNPFKDTSINDLAKRDDIPFTRQKLTDCIKAAAVDMELNKSGYHPEHLHFEHKGQIARLKTREQRLEVARVANENKLTSNELKKLIDNMLGKTSSQDKQIGRTLIRQHREFVRLAADEDVQSFLSDKERSAALDHTEMAQLLDFSGKFRETLADSQEMLKQLEANLRENCIEKKQDKVLENGKEAQKLLA